MADDNKLAKRGGDELTRIQGEYDDPERIRQWMGWAARHCRLVAPAPNVASVPEGFGVALSVVTPDIHDTYEVGGGKRAHGRATLQQIGAAAGVSWDAQQSGRLDDGSDPHYCHYRAVGVVRQFDASELVIIGDKEMDLREGSAQIVSMHERYERKLAQWLKGGKRGKRAKDPTAQISEMRLHILSHAQTKAQLRAIRSMGVQSSYTGDELGKPFVVAKLIFTGQSDDPELRRQFSGLVASRYLGARTALFGAPGQPQLPPRAERHAPPEVGNVPLEPDDATPSAPEVQTPPPPCSAPEPEGFDEPDLPPEAYADEPEPEPDDGEAQAEHVVPGRGQHGGKPLADAPTHVLRWWAQRISENLHNGKTPDKYRFRDTNLLAAMEAELGRRDAGGAGEVRP